MLGPRVEHKCAAQLIMLKVQGQESQITMIWLPKGDPLEENVSHTCATDAIIYRDHQSDELS